VRFSSVNEPLRSGSNPLSLTSSETNILMDIERFRREMACLRKIGMVTV
jgi:hypothetical protein